MKIVPVLAVKKALDMLEILADGDSDGAGLSLSELARSMGLALNTARNLLKTMIVCGFVAQNEQGRYFIGPKCERLGQGRRCRRLVDLAIPLLKALGADIEEVVLLTVLRNGERRMVAQMAPQRSIRVDPDAMPPPGLYEFVTGRVLLAHADEEEWRRILHRHGFPGSQWSGIDTEAKLRAAASNIRRLGECVTIQQKEGLVALAVPVLTPDGSLLGALGCYAPAFRCPEKRRCRILGDMRRTANALAERWEAES